MLQAPLHWSEIPFNHINAALLQWKQYLLISIEKQQQFPLWKSMSYCEVQIIMELLIRALGFVLAIVIIHRLPTFLSLVRLKTNGWLFYKYSGAFHLVYLSICWIRSVKLCIRYNICEHLANMDYFCSCSPKSHKLFFFSFLVWKWLNKLMQFHLQYMHAGQIFTSEASSKQVKNKTNTKQTQKKERKKEAFKASQKTKTNTN